MRSLNCLEHQFQGVIFFHWDAIFYHNLILSWKENDKQRNMSDCQVPWWCFSDREGCVFCVVNPCCLVGDRAVPPEAGRQHSGVDVRGPREGDGRRWATWKGLCGVDRGLHRTSRNNNQSLKCRRLHLSVRYQKAGLFDIRSGNGNLLQVGNS